MFSTAILMFTDQCSIGKTNINWMNNVYFFSSSKHQNHWFASYVNPVFFFRYFKICPIIWRYVDGFKLWRKSSFGPPPVIQILMDKGYGMTLTCIIVQLKGDTLLIVSLVYNDSTKAILNTIKWRHYRKIVHLGEFKLVVAF